MERHPAPHEPHELEDLTSRAYAFIDSIDKLLKEHGEEPIIRRYVEKAPPGYVFTCYLTDGSALLVTNGASEANKIEQFEFDESNPFMTRSLVADIGRSNNTLKLYGDVRHYNGLRVAELSPSSTYNIAIIANRL